MHEEHVVGAALAHLPRGVADRTLETWLVKYETGVTPTGTFTSELFSSMFSEN